MFYSTHPHIFTWVVAVILFIVAVVLFKNGMAKQMKIVHMVLRLFYILIIITGGILFFEFASIDHMMYGLKTVLGIVLIGFSEMVLVRMTKGKSTKGVLIGLVVSFIVILYLGFSMPIGFDFLS
ncbi:YisL family protein [Salipaludibacillus sp. HK11]|uniref:YisL family protein n=1 Tax=Salipaludibacillus sp. HK11 TaxID=3394320 RepID=UPI0039FD44D6